LPALNETGLLKAWRMDLQDLGWCDFFAEKAKEFGAADLRPARVSAVDRGVSFVVNEEGERPTVIPGRFRREAASPAEYPVTGDWVLAREVPREEKWVIETVLPRRTEISRTAAGGVTERQVLAANVDTVFVVASLSDEINLRRLERYLTTVCEGSAQPVLLLTKTDLCEDVPGAIAEVKRISAGTPIVALSSVSGEGLVQIKKWLKAGKTCTLIGPSGVGKSTLINALYEDEILPVLPVREKDQKGRHTTTRRELILLPNGTLIIDTPGLRELQLWEGQTGLTESFADIEDLATKCRFSDCRHESEPGCAVRKALETGGLEQERLSGFLKLQREVEAFASKRDARAQAEQRRKTKVMTKNLQTRLREKGRID
jgi:ribosome biogenesis GTPase / thiamine phosphate phosphatase